MADDWTCSTNDALSISLGQQSFHPTFTYPIYGDAEAVWGYKGLQIRLTLGQADLRPAVRVSWDAKNERAGKTVDDVQGTLLPFLPEEGDTLVASSEEEYTKHVNQLEQQQGPFHPPGQKISEFTLPRKKGKGKAILGPSAETESGKSDSGRTFEIYRCTWADEGFPALFLRLRILTLFFIEGASYFDLNEPGWEFLLLYEKAGESYTFAGFTSLYHFWVFPRYSRVRLSQFLILPPYQHQGLGKRLYAAVYNRVLLAGEDAFLTAPGVDVSVSELTVEDPSEAFDALRDQGDLLRLLHPASAAALAPMPGVPQITDVRDALQAGKLVPPLDAQWAGSLRSKLRLAARQWARLLEMVTLLALVQSEADGSKWKAYRLMVKTRLYRKNADVLSQLDELTRRVKLQETYENVLFGEYAERLGAELRDEWVRALLPHELVPEEGEEEDDEDAPPTGDKHTLDWLEQQVGAKRVRLE